MQVLDNVEAWVLALTATGWVYPALYALATIDGFFPPVPSESVVIALVVASRTNGSPELLGVFALAALGAWSGDMIAFQIGRRIPVHRVPFLRTERGTAALAWAQRALSRRGGSFILGARYVPVGRVAVNMTAGAVGYPLRTFAGVAALAAVTWAGFSIAIGLASAQWLGHEPLLAMAIGICLGVLLGIVVDRVMSAVMARRGVAPARPSRRPDRTAEDGPGPATRAGETGADQGGGVDGGATGDGRS